MPLTCTQVPEIDATVTKGLHIGYFGKDENLSELPSVIGDWNIRTIYDRIVPDTGYIVAVPSNTRTRLLYIEGRISWLRSLGFSPIQAELYIRASTIVSGKWEHPVAEFVQNNFNIDEFILNEVLHSDKPKRLLAEEGIRTKLSTRKVLTACQILFNIKAILQGA